MMLISSARRLFRSTAKSARSSELITSWSGGPEAGRELVTDLAPGEPDEHVLEGHLAVGDLANLGVVLVLGDQVLRCLTRQQRAVVDDRDAIADGLGLLHRMGGQEDAPALLSDVLDPTPELTTGLRIETSRRLVEQQQRRIVNDRDVQREALLLSARELLERLARLTLEPDLLSPAVISGSDSRTP